ncbi:hypothetical protein N7490_001336 [Penicillium lividum]|nr:hypothetical protein N7490_001336 [Penicillium lividum]
MGARSRFGCLSCRRRKKKCDERKPTCTACLRNSLGCLWPDSSPQAILTLRLQALNTRNELDARALVFGEHPNFPTRSIPSCPSHFALPGSISPVAGTWRLLDHYLKDTANRLACLQDSKNPFLHTLLPAALNDELLMNSILALSGVHMMQRLPQLDQEMQILTWSSYNRAMKQLRVALSTDFIFYLLEATRGTDHKAMQKHLDGAHYLMAYIIRSSNSSHSSIVSLATELYVYNSSLASFTTNCPPTPLPIHASPIKSDGVMCGCAHELFSYIPKVSALMWEFASHDSKLPRKDLILQYHLLSAQIKIWKPYSDQSGMILCAELYQQSLLLLLDFQFTSNGSQIDIENAFQSLEFLLARFPPTSPMATTATWPLFVFGIIAHNDHHKTLIQSYLQGSVKEFGMGVMSTALGHLEEIWKEESDQNLVTRFFSNQNNDQGEDQEQVQFDSPPIVGPSVQDTCESIESEVKATHSRHLQELWDEASSTILDQLPEVDVSIDIRSRLNDVAVVKTSQSDSLASLHRRLANTTIPSFLIHMPAILVQYYFDFVCKAWSSFDSPLNPFRLIVSRLWSQNAAIYYAIQSMAAASLANDFPSMRAIGIQTQQQAIACLRNNPRIGSLHRDDHDDEYFLALLMIGLTTAWHNAADLGLEYLKEAKDYLVNQQQMCQNPESTFAKQYPLFQQCLLYWNMMAAFVAEDSLLLNEEKVLERPDTEMSVYLVDGQALPHPWTGPLSKSISLFYQTAKLIRAARISYRTRSDDLDLANIDFNFLVEEIHQHETAERLEEEILFTGISSYCGPVDIGDTDTPPTHFITLAETYRCTALLQIYHVFPDILDERLQRESLPEQEPSVLFSLLFGVNFTLPSAEEARRVLALHIVSLLDQIPPTSGTRCMHPVVLTCISSDLGFSNQSLFGPAANAIACLSALDVEIAQARRKVSMWFSELTLILPKLRLQRMSRIVHETWSRADAGVGEYWLDTMLEHNLETMMG